MKLTPEEVTFLTALAREQNQTGCRGPAHDLLRQHAYPDAPLTGPGSLAFSYEAVPLTGLLVGHFKDLQEIDDFLRRGDRILEVRWPWVSAAEYRARLAEARRAGNAAGAETRS
jgi:hypothetical protein